MTAIQLPDGPLAVDASFLLSIAGQEADATRFASVLNRAVITSINFGEVIYKLHATADVSAADTEHNFKDLLGVDVQAVDLAVTRHFADLKAIDARARDSQTSDQAPPKTLSLADMTCLGFALENQLPVLTGDRHWRSLGPHGMSVAVFDYRDPNLVA